MLLYPRVFGDPFSDVVESLIIDEDGPQCDAILSGAGAEEIIKNHIQWTAIVNEALSIFDECLVITIAGGHDDMDETQQAIIRVYSRNRHQQVPQIIEYALDSFVVVPVLD